MTMSGDTVLRTLGAIELVLLCANLFAIIYILKCYIIRLKIRSKFVLMFYSFSLLLTILIIAQCTALLTRADFKMQQDPTGPNLPTMSNLFESAIKFVSAALGFCIVATMYKIAISMEYVLGCMTLEEKRRKKRCFYWFCLICPILIIPEVFLVYLV